MKQLRQFRQGDVFLIEVPGALPEETMAKAKPMARDESRGKFVLAYGEVTGHAHVVDVAEEDQAEMFTAEDQRFLRMVETGHLRHEEHGEIEVPPGTYRVVQQREYTEDNAQRQMAVLD